MTADQLKLLLQTPLLLFLLMLAASLSNGLKQVYTANQAGGSTSLKTYFLTHWPDTLGMVLANVIAFAVLILTDQLNFASALGIGYGANSLVDLLPGTRSDNLMSQPTLKANFP